MTEFNYIRHSVSLGVDWEPVSKKEMLFDLQGTHSDAEAAVEYIESNPGEKVYGLSYSYKAVAVTDRARRELTDQEIAAIVEETVEAFRKKNTKVIVYDEAAEYGEIIFDAEGVEVALIWDADDFDGLFDVMLVERYYVPMMPPGTVMHKITDTDSLIGIGRDRLGERIFDGHFWAYYEVHGGRATARMHAGRLGPTETLRSFMR